MPLKPLEKLATTPYLPHEHAFKPGIADIIAGRRTIGEMKADEYLKLAQQLQQELSERKSSNSARG